MSPFKTSSLSPDHLRIIQDKGTEYPFSGEYNTLNEPGTYLCRQCGLALFRAQSKFHSGCGWPSFDTDIPGNVERVTDRDNQRTEIRCKRCAAHLGHVFEGEGYTALNTRHCVNSLSLDFVADTNVLDTEEAILAAGCFWGVEYYLKKCTGVLKVEVGYTGGVLEDPTYEQVCTGNSGHVEALRVIFDPKQISYLKLIQYFFEIHDPSQSNGQGPDMGAQYLSKIFYYEKNQQETAQSVVEQLREMNIRVATQLQATQVFWPAEEYHQDYYAKNHKQPYCHHYTKRFKEG